LKKKKKYPKFKEYLRSGVGNQLGQDNAIPSQKKKRKKKSKFYCK
jgi:hypothetical protein